MAWTLPQLCKSCMTSPSLGLHSLHALPPGLVRYMCEDNPSLNPRPPKLNFQVRSTAIAAPAFGFSAGDFISAVNLIVDINKALKNAGGASENYRQVVTELDLLQQVLRQLQSRQSSSNPSSILTSYAEQQAKITLSALTEFLSLISKFNNMLGPNASPQWYCHVGRKAHWDILYSKHVEGLRLRIGTQLHVLNTIIQLDQLCVHSAQLLQQVYYLLHSS